MMDWTRCVICQEVLNEGLRCPLNAAGSGDKSKPYTSFLNNVAAFRQMKKLPMELYFTANITAEELVEHRAQWHKTCHMKFNATNLERAEKKRAREDATGNDVPEKRLHKRQPPDKNACVFCRNEDGRLHAFSSYDAELHTRKMALELQDISLLNRIGGGDLVAIEAKYHFTCLTKYRNHYRSVMRKSQNTSDTHHEVQHIHARVFVELITYIENSVEGGQFYFKCAELRHLYEKRLQEFGIEKEMNKVHFKEKILKYFPEAQEQSDGKNVIIVFQQGMQAMLKQAMNSDYESDVLALANAAKIVRHDIFNSKNIKFDATFPTACQEKSVPTSLKLLVSMLLNGSNLKDQDSSDSQQCLTISQTVLFNCKKRATTAAKSRHALNYEPPLPLYIGLHIHTQTRSKKLVTQLYDLGLSVSYDRVLQVESQLASAVCQQAEEKGIVCPSTMRHGLFTVGALDNLDHNPSSTTAKGSFHGTGISLFQFPTTSCAGGIQNSLTLTSANAQRKYALPDSYTTVPAVALKKDNVSVTKPREGMMNPVHGHLEGAKGKENCWLEHAMKLIDVETISEDAKVAWAAYHTATQNVSDDLQPALTQLLPLFYEKSATAAMIKHGMDVHNQATQYLNPGQIPVMAMDEPLFALAKYVQWKWNQTHGENKYVIMFGGLHIEMALWRTYGDYLEGSGWISSLTQAGVASQGTADSFLRASHLTRTRHAHQLTALTLAKLQERAFISTGNRHTEEEKEAWRVDMVKRSPTFQYWDTILQMEILGLIFIRAHRERDFRLYVESLKAIVAWFFALDHQNYARWISVHIRDMESLPPTILEEFETHGNWVIPKTSKRFSTIPIDQAHEQNNELVKGTGGAVGLTENPSAFMKWMTAGPEQARLLKEFETQYFSREDDNQYHHEEGVATQKSFKQQTCDLVETITDMGNPFLEESSELLTLDTHNVMDESVVNTVRTIQALGTDQYTKYHMSVLVDCTHSIHEPIQKNSLPLFKSPACKVKSKQAEEISMLKNEVSLFSQLYIVMRHRDCDMDTFFKHENHPYPPSLADRGKLRQGKKSDLLTCLEQSNQVEPPSYFDVRVLDGAAVVHFLPTRGVTTFDDYASDVFVAYILKLLETSNRVDVVWDTYLDSSIKASMREMRGKGFQRKVAPKNKVPGNWQQFLRNPTNKQELFTFLSDRIASTSFPAEKEVRITSGQSVKGTSLDMVECDHEEADTRIVIHLLHALAHGCTTCMVRTVDTDVVVILVGMFHHLLNTSPAADIWVAFGTGKTFTHLHINHVAQALGEQKCLALPAFHSFTGCDTVSCFFGRGKKLAWQAWRSYPEVTQVFSFMASNPFSELNADDNNFTLLERYIVVLYDQTSSLESVNEARKDIFCQKNRTMEHIPPSQDALLQHSKRAAYQAGIWATSHQVQQQRPTPDAWGWTRVGDSQTWTPLWTTLPIASKACSVLVKCSCKSTSGCTGRCTCRKAGWKCTDLCSCKCDK